ncbi:MAG TPA: hypothetical protein VF944_00890 [Candidatus Bathyarchaeia archaeon]
MPPLRFASKITSTGGLLRRPVNNPGRNPRVTRNLNLHANPILAERLEEVLVQQQPPSSTAPGHAGTTTIAAQTWTEFVARLKINDWDGADHFLSLEERPSLDGLRINEISQVLESLEEMFTDPNPHYS